MMRALRSDQRGQSMFEFNMSLPFLMPIMLVVMMLVVQWAFLFSAKSTLDAATVKAVREGALNYGKLSAINAGLAEGLMPLYANGTDTTDIVSAYARSRAAVTLLGNVIILNPNAEVFDKFNIEIYHGRDRYQEIPNDNLMYRSTALTQLSDERQLNLQDANLLQIEVQWCQKMVVPFANSVIENVVNSGLLFNPSSQQLRCNAIGIASGEKYLAMTSQGLMRMQTPFRQ